MNQNKDVHIYLNSRLLLIQYKIVCHQQMHKTVIIRNYFSFLLSRKEVGGNQLGLSCYCLIYSLDIEPIVICYNFIPDKEIRFERNSFIYEKEKKKKGKPHITRWIHAEL